MLPSFGGEVPQMQLPALPPGSALKFGAAQAPAQGRLSHSRALMSNLESEMSRLLEWAGGTEPDAPAQRRTRVDPTVSANGRHEVLRDFLEERADVHQKRAKRRELAEPTAVRLPRESQSMAPRRRTQREVSYLSDRSQAPRDPASVPASMIPDAFRILLEAPFPHAEPQFYGMFGEDSDWTHNPLTRQWERIVFPSKVPAGRRDVQLLHAWVSDMVDRLKKTAGSLPEESVLKEAQVLFSVAFHEMIRQVSVHCLERGHLMGKIWWSEMELFQRLLQMRRADAQHMAREREAHRHELDKLRHQVVQLQAKLDEHGLA
tara:strand:- start:298 stop:1251 length:954 start_codon:yes stop_codon:yes gene_type:complete